MFGEFNPDLSDVFSLGITFIRLDLILNENDIQDMNNENKGK